MDVGYIYLYKPINKSSMKKVFLLRFGVPTPTRGDIMAIDRLGCRDTSAGCGTPFGILSIFGTDKSPAEIAQIFKEVSAECNDNLPVIVWQEGEQVGLNMDPEFFEHFEPMNAEWEREYGSVAIKKCTMSLDDLLDIVAMKGMKALTEEQLTRLKDLSK
ncbi:hypothetical protein UFOVP699_176 [uncultured Caudovirales phage]|uniref:Uncharacterized protein n=1 Tax=uncultured Caudovirales phage TaxID=2100421 RepID=A0A6J5NI33_9CAUD|nr:hypothetical protein UFOVP699_176 [uncultured Caudovirales phage]